VAERALRKPVLWRKGSFGSNSGRGLRFVERILTVGETCRQHKRGMLDYLTRAIEAHRAGSPAPLLLPTH
jgi:transposase